jgi:ABC transport system ATP-binding/permease protein
VGNQVAQKPQAPPLLVRTRRSDHRLESGTEYRIGRAPDADIQLDDSRVSWRHAILRADGQSWVLVDQGSTNGTYVGAERKDRVDIRSNCVVRLGNPEDGPVLRFEPQLPPEPPRRRRPEPDEANFANLPSVDKRPTATHRLPPPAKVMRIGRTPDNDVRVDDLGVSRKHAELRKSASGTYQIVDLGSHNGTYVNGSRVEMAEISENDIIGIGHATFRLADGELREFVDRGNVSFEARDLVVRVNADGKPKILLEGITFPLPERSFLAVIGPAGAGKSTLLNALTGKRPAAEGTVLYDNRDLYKSYDELRHRIGLVPQQSCTHDQLTARSALGYAAELRFPSDTGATERRARVEEVLGELEMTEHGNTRVERLSGGQNKRVNIGLELLTRPSLLFLDEPTSPLDPHLKRELMEKMRRMADKDAEEGQSVIVITHDVESKLLDLADRLIVLAPGGKMAYFGPPKEGLKYFGKDDWADVFKEFSSDPRRDWMGEYKKSTDYRRYIEQPMTPSPRRTAPPTPEQREEAAPPRQRGRLRQLSTLSRRYARVMSVDRGYLMFTALLPLILGVLVRVVSGSNGLFSGQNDTSSKNVQTTLLILVMAACLSGTANSIREIIKEREIYERERMAGLSPGAYLFSKVMVLGLVSVIQTLIIVALGLVGQKMPPKSVFGQPLAEILIATAVLCLVSMLLGLMVSTLVTKGEQTMPALVVITMLEVVFSGGVLALVGAAAWVASIAPARWGFGALASTVGLNKINDELAPPTKPGQRPPAVAHDALWNQTHAQWGTDIGVLVAIGVICLIVAWWRLNKSSAGGRR